MAYGILAPQPGSNLCPLHWKYGVSTIGPALMELEFFTKCPTIINPCTFGKSGTENRSGKIWKPVPYRLWKVPKSPLIDCCFSSLAWAFFKKYNFYLSIFGCAGSLLLCGPLSSCSKWGLLSSCGSRASPCGGFSLQSTASGASAVTAPSSRAQAK